MTALHTALTALRGLRDKWRDPEFWNERGSAMDSGDCARELDALLASLPSTEPTPAGADVDRSGLPVRTPADSLASESDHGSVSPSAPVAWGAKGCGPCAKCRAEAERMEREFWRGVFFGDWDADGYKRGERRAA